MREILQQIVTHKKEEVATREMNRSINELIAMPHFARATNSLTAELSEPTSTGIIAEFKRRSPSKQNINLSADLLDVLGTYADHKVSAFSILTDEHFFGGSDSYLIQARKAFPNIPILRKEFIIDEYQVYETKALGADVMLLIAEILTKTEIDQLAGIGKELGLEILLEVHSVDQLPKLSEHISIIGVNNRDLNTFEIDYDRSKRLLKTLPKELPKIAESGLSDPNILADLYQSGFHGFLIGEHFMRLDDRSTNMAKFMFHYMSRR